MPIFNVPEIVTPRPEKKINSASSNTDHIKKGRDSSPPPITNITQDLSNLIIDQPEYSVASSSKSIAKQWDFVPTDISPPPEIEHIESVDDEVESPEIIELVNDEPEISLDLSTNDEEAKLRISNSPKTSNEEET
ncbi:14537_t:CDS:1, partial [Entrophospora sp. SA101]